MAGSEGTNGDQFEHGRAAVPETGSTKTSELPQVEPADSVAPSAPPAPSSLTGDGGDGSERAVVGDGSRALRGLFWLLAVVGLVVALVLGVQATGLLPHWRNPFGSKTTDRSQPVLLKSIQDLSRFVAAEGNFQVVIDLQNDRKYVPDFLLNDRTLFVAAGTVEAYVDFASIGQGAITDSADHKTVQIKLPAPALGKPNLNHEKSYVFAQQRGLLNRVGDVFAGDPNRQQQLYLLGEQKIADAAQQSELIDRARDNTHKMLDAMLHSLGYTSITITFAAP